ncbi:MAG: hypothetical protein ABJB61_05520 [bacterium]
MKRSILVASLLVSLVFVSVPLATNAQGSRLTLFLYAAKFVCGKADEKIASPGQYFTAINVHNASPTTKAIYIKRFAIALPEEKPGKISEFARGTLGPDEAMLIDCENIYRHTGVPSGQFLEGYALLYALSELDVVSVYTAGHSEVETLHTERVPARRFPIGRTAAISRRMLEQQ